MYVKVEFGSCHHRYNRRYTKYFGNKGDCGPELTGYALINYLKWIEAIEKWQSPVLQNRFLCKNLVLRKRKGNQLFDDCVCFFAVFKTGRGIKFILRNAKFKLLFRANFSFHSTLVLLIHFYRYWVFHNAYQLPPYVSHHSF